MPSSTSVAATFETVDDIDYLHGLATDKYNEHRPHTGCGNQPPSSRLINVPGQYI
ncbi:hypothetical protein [Kocuria sp. ZOR0020]|uniref:hypothetical protein n=1 Tax=Kocuria sp. ZOR0020 TaxID=1339234 RepID=UPI000A48B5A1|nr:hypothetical protein [Kocuria sp. ZOR0020]